jgi:methyl-accepting chemotaxis protein
VTDVVASIRRVSDIVGEIAAASSEQASGVSRVGGAVTQLEKSTQRNAALVEEIAAAMSMKTQAQAQDLIQVVSTFRLEAA